MRHLTMRNAEGAQLGVEVDESAVVESGAFGAVYEPLNDPGFVVKKIPLEMPEPVGNIPRHVAHIKTTRARLLEIHAQEEGRRRPSRFIVDSIDELIRHSLATHWCFDRSNMTITAVWYRQRKAPGRELIRAFHDAVPPPPTRIAIARNLVARMRTLRRSDLAHLDCVPDNIFVDGDFVTLIDLDGCGVIRRKNGAEPSDDWDYYPMTLGHLGAVRPPPWYPQPGIDLQPRSGNYLFAERWVVMDTIIRILTWNELPGALSWLAPSVQRQLVGGYASVGRELATLRQAGEHVDSGVWRRVVHRVLNDLRTSVGRLSDVGLSPKYPHCLESFASLAQAACLDASALSALRSPYDIFRDWLI